MSTAIKHPVSDRVKQSFVIFDIRTFWRSGPRVIVPGCQKLQMTPYNPVWHRMLYTPPYDNSGSQRVNVHLCKPYVDDVTVALTMTLTTAGGPTDVAMQPSSEPINRCDDWLCSLTVPSRRQPDSLRLQRSVDSADNFCRPYSSHTTSHTLSK